MKPSTRQKTIALVVLGLLLTTGLCRFKNSIFNVESQSSTKNKNYCVGVEHPDSSLGLVCTTGPSRVMMDAVHFLEVPSGCLDVTLPPDLPLGSHIKLIEEAGSCTLDKTEPLKGEMRLLAGGLFNINKDSEQDIMLLPGIGEVKAKRIVESRRIDGPFQDTYDLTRVKGIGDKTAKKINLWLEW